MKMELNEFLCSLKNDCCHIGNEKPDVLLTQQAGCEPEN